MNKTQLIDEVSSKTGLSKADAGRALEATLDAITKALVSRDQVAIIGFGTFDARDRKARTGRDPRTGGTLQIPASTVPTFKAGKGLKDAVNGK